MAGAIREFGFRIPVIAKSDGAVIDGHLRLKAARKLNMDHVPVVLADELTDAQVKAFRLLVNKSVEWAAWDEDLLRIEMEDLQNLGYDLENTGFDIASIDELLKSCESGAGLTDPDDVPEASDQIVSRIGDLWVLGNHRLLCGDSTIATDVERLLGEVKPLLMVTDPPYGVEYDPDWRNRADRVNGKSYGARATGRVSNDDRVDWRDAWIIFPGDVAYVWHAARHGSLVQESLEASGFDIRSQIIWAKSNFAISRGNYHWQHEPCWYAVRKGKRGNWTGDRKQTTLWQISKPLKSETGHSTQKPVECMLRPIENNSSPGQAVYEPFSGSGTTIIAAEQTGRCCYAVEINPSYVDIAVMRWQSFTGKQAVLDGSHETFEDVKRERS